MAVVLGNRRVIFTGRDELFVCVFDGEVEVCFVLADRIEPSMCYFLELGAEDLENEPSVVYAQRHQIDLLPSYGSPGDGGVFILEIRGEFGSVVTLASISIADGVKGHLPP